MAFEPGGGVPVTPVDPLTVSGSVVVFGESVFLPGLVVSTVVVDVAADGRPAGPAGVTAVFAGSDAVGDDGSGADTPASVGSAHAMPGVLATAEPTPRATASAPTRPMYLA